MTLWKRLKGKLSKKNQVDARVADDLIAKTHQEIDRMAPLNIIVAGKTGSGKSTLINALFREEIAETGVGLPITQNLEKITKKGVPLTLYDTKGLELTPQSQAEVLQSLLNLIERQMEKGSREAIHLLYYTLNANMARIEPFEIDLIRQLAEKAPVLLILTQAYDESAKDFKEYLEDLDLPVQGVIPVLAKALVVQGKERIPAYNLQLVIDKSLALIPSEVVRAFTNAQQIDIELKVQQARNWAKRYVKTAFGIGFTPIPIADATLLVPMQITMLAHLSAIIGVSLDKAQIISVIAGIGGTGGATIAGKYIASSLIKAIPGVGSVTGGLISGATASSLTIALGYSYIEVLRQITLAEKRGDHLGLREIQRLMNLNLSEQMSIVSEFLPDELKQSDFLSWFDDYYKD